MTRFFLIASLVALAPSGLFAQTPDLYDETVLRTIDLTFPQANWYTLLEQNYGTGVDLPADMTIDGVTYPTVGVRFRGYSSYLFIGGSDKKPFNISMDAIDSGQKLYGYKTLNLNNGYRDPTFTREVICYHIYRQYMPACRANWVVLRVNGVNWGVYINVEQMNKDMMRKWFVDEDGIRYEGDATLPNATTNGSALTWLGTSEVPYENNYSLKNPTGAPGAWNPLIDACDVLNNEPLPTLSPAVQQKLNVDSAFWYLAGQVLFVNPDSYLYYGHNYWLYHDVYHDRMQTLPWGLNMTLAATSLAGFSTAQRIGFDLFYNQSHLGRPLMNRLFAVPELRERYLAHARTITDEWFDWSIIGPRIAAYQALIGAEVALDNKKLYPTSAFTSNLTSNYSIGFFSGSVTGLQPLIDGRRQYLLNHPELSKPAPTVAAAVHQPTSPAAGQTVWVTALVNGPSAPVGSVTLYSRTRGAFAETAMFDDGMHMDGAAGDGVYGGALPTYSAGARVEYYVGAASDAASGGAMTFFPRTAEFQPLSVQLPVVPGGPSSIQINEFLAKNDNGIVDEMGELEDWIELHNPTSAPIGVGGMYLTDNLSFPTKWMIPAGNVLQPGETMLVFADNDPLDGPLHATFKLSAGGEDIGLFASDGVTLLDGMVFGPQEPDISTGLLFDSGTLRVTLMVPSPDAPNMLSGCGARAYSALDSTTHSVDLAVTGFLNPGSTATAQIRQGVPNTVHVLYGATEAQYFPVPGDTVTLLIGPAGLQPFGQGATDALGQLDLAVGIPNLPWLVGMDFYVQVAAITPTGFDGSNAFEITICP